MLWWQTVWRTPGLHEYIRGVYINVRILLNTFRWEGATFPECNHRLSDPSRCVLCFVINPYSGKNLWFILALPCSCQMPDDLGPRAEVQIPEEEEEDVKGEMETLITEEVTEQWDCESILSKYSLQGACSDEILFSLWCALMGGVAGQCWVGFVLLSMWV